MTTRSRHELTAEDKTGKAFRSARKNVEGYDKALGALGGRMVSIAGIAGFGALIKGAIDAGDRIEKLSRRIGASTEALSEYEHVAKLTGVQIGTLTTAWQRQTRRVAEAAAGVGEASKALDELQLSAEDLKDLAPEKQFEVLADALSGVKNQSDRVRLAMKFWDSEGVALLQTIEGGSDALHEMRAEARDLGITLDQVSANELAAANSSLTRLEVSADSLSRTLAVELAPSIALTADVAAAAVKPLFAWLRAFNLLEIASVSLRTGLALGTGEFSKAKGEIETWWEDVGVAFEGGSTKIDAAFARWREGADGAGDALERLGRRGETVLVTLPKIVAPRLREVNVEIDDLDFSTELAAKRIDTLGDAFQAVETKAPLAAQALGIYSDAAREASGATDPSAPGRAAQPPRMIGQVEVGPDGHPVEGSRALGRIYHNGRWVTPSSLGHFATGGEVPVTGMYRLEAGERVVSQSTSIGPIHLTVNGSNMSGTDLWRWVRDALIPELEIANR